MEYIATQVHTRFPQNNDDMCYSLDSYSSKPPHTMNDDSSPEHLSHLQIIIDCAKRVLTKGQVMIVTMIPHTVLWVTNSTQSELTNSASDFDGVALALESRMSRENANKVAEYVLRTSEQNVLGIQSRNVTDIFAADRQCKASFDCYYEEPDFMTVVSLLTPSALTDSALEYDQAQLSSMRYLVGVILHQQTAHVSSSSYLSSSAASREVHEHHEKYIRSLFPEGYLPAEHKATYQTMAEMVDVPEYQPGPLMNDFIPAISCREIDYFYSMIPGSTMGTYSRHENHLQHAESVQEQEQNATDPDNLDPHHRMRQLQAMSLTQVIPRQPRDFAEVQAEIELGQRRNESGGDRYHNNDKNAGIKCLECGADSSPEWRKGPQGPKTLCNRCGLRYAKKLRQQSNR